MGIFGKKDKSDKPDAHVFTGVIGWSNKRVGTEFYHSFEEGRWAERSSRSWGGEVDRPHWGKLLTDTIDDSLSRSGSGGGASEGSDVLVIVLPRFSGIKIGELEKVIRKVLDTQEG